MKSILFHCFLFLLTYVPQTGWSQTIQASEFETVLGDNWKGDLMYLDYQSDKEVSIPVDLRVEKLKENSYRFVYSFPREPQANSSSKVKLSKDGRKIAGHAIVSREELEGGGLKVVCESKGKDNGKAADMVYTYSLGRTELKIRKDVRYKDSAEVFLRNVYRFKR